MFLQSFFSYHPVNAVNIVPTVPTHYSSSFPIFLLSLPLPPVPPFLSPPLPSSGHTPLLCRQGETAEAADEQGEQREAR